MNDDEEIPTIASVSQLSARLPVELFLMVKERVPMSDLRTHVCFYHACQTFASFYGDNSQQANFWRKACALSGIGWLKTDSSWKEIAFETIIKDGFCAHPQCGGTLLDQNARKVSEAMRLYGWDPEDGAWDANFDDVAEEWVAEDRPIPVCNQIFQWIAFSRNPCPPWAQGNADARLRPTDGRHKLENGSVCDHPVAARSFATFPTIRQMRFHYNNNSYGSKAISATGVTVWAVVRTIHADLDIELSIPELTDLLTGPLQAVIKNKPSYDFVGDLQRFSTMRGLWSDCRWDGLYYIRADTDGPVFQSTFSAVLDRDNESGDETYEPVSAE